MVASTELIMKLRICCTDIVKLVRVCMTGVGAY